MASVYEFNDYRKFLAKQLSIMPNQGYGQMSKLASHLGVHSTLISQILKEHKNLTVDQAALVADFFGMNELETEFFVLLVSLDRAGNWAAKNIYKKQLQKIKDQVRNISQRVTVAAKLNEEQRAVFYSDWAYSAIRQSVSLPGIDTVDAIAEFFQFPRNKVQYFLEFLIKTGLCTVANGKLKSGPASTHVDAKSPWVRVHHTNWRQRAMHSLDKIQNDDLHYTSPLTLSKADAKIVQEKIIQFIEQINKVVDPSPSESLFCLNIDWFEEGFA
jgi:uncharacterized protein (TIGR02147 family)